MEFEIIFQACLFLLLLSGFGFFIFTFRTTLDELSFDQNFDNTISYQVVRGNSVHMRATLVESESK